MAKMHPPRPQRWLTEPIASKHAFCWNITTGERVCSNTMAHEIHLVRDLTGNENDIAPRKELVIDAF